ncbi:hypothetical protein EON64_07800 [archaeon]|nr:MAG: hypothetical protein EON64_07800 [archaeon]
MYSIERDYLDEVISLTEQLRSFAADREDIDLQTVQRRIKELEKAIKSITYNATGELPDLDETQEMEVE